MTINKVLQIKNSSLYVCAGQVIVIGVCVFWTGIDCSSLEGSPDKFSPFCPHGWFQAQNFCLARAQGGSEKGVAMYCDSYGGIGVKGFCIIRAKSSQDEPPGSIQEPSLAAVTKSLDRRDLLLRLLNGPMNHRFLKGRKKAYGDTDLEELYGDAPSDVTSRDVAESVGESVTDSSGVSGSRLCPVGWYNHRLLCIYKPSPIEKQCHELGATEFHGLCIKHANVPSAESSSLESHQQKSKRVCCCAHPSAMANKYAC